MLPSHAARINYEENEHVTAAHVSHIHIDGTVYKSPLINEGHKVPHTPFIGSTSTLMPLRASSVKIQLKSSIR